MAPSSSQSTAKTSRIHLALTCISIAANALCAGGIFTFPLLSPALAEHLKLTQPQLTTIVLAGMMGQYPFAAAVGRAIDLYGPWSCSLASSMLFSLGFGMFSREVAKTSDDLTAPSSSSFERLSLFYFMAGLGTVTSYFSSLFAASKNFPEYSGVAAGTSMALFGLSPLFLSILASTWFTDNAGTLDVTNFVAFMAVLAGVVHIIGAINLRTPKPNVVPLQSGVRRERLSSSGDRENASAVDERTSLLRPSSLRPEQQSVLGLLKDPYFLLLGSLVLVTLGSCEMVISNIGTIVISLPSSLSSTTSASSSVTATATQVRLLSLSNTFSRLLVGPLADFVSPVASYLPCGTLHYPRKHRISRVAFLSMSCALLTVTFGCMLVEIRSQQRLWLLSLGTGVAYGATFTVLPSIVSAIWGMHNLGRNFGVITYAPFIGTPLFSYLYAFVSASHAQHSSGDGLVIGESNVCKGAECWQLTFIVSFLTSSAGLLVSFVLWAKWRGRV